MKINTFKSISFIAVLGIGIAAISCSTPHEVEELTFINKITISNEDTTDGSQKFKGDAHGGQYFSHTDTASGMYGSSVTYSIPDSLVQKDVRVKVNMWVKQGDFNGKNQFAVSLESPDKGIILWSQIVFQNHVKETNKWINVIDSVTVPGSSIDKPGYVLKMFPFNPEQTSYMDTDDTEISIFKVVKKMVE